jgi:hypothetical protein
MRERVVSGARVVARLELVAGGRLARGVRRWIGMWSRLWERVLWWGVVG